MTSHLVNSRRSIEKYLCPNCYSLLNTVYLTDFCQFCRYPNAAKSQIQIAQRVAGGSAHSFKSIADLQELARLGICNIDFMPTVPCNKCGCKYFYTVEQAPKTYACCNINCLDISICQVNLPINI